MNLMSALCRAIARFEGFFKPGSRAQRNNNPGNLRAAKRATGKDPGGYAVFPTPEEGWLALRDQILLDAGRGLTLGAFLEKYAPPSENDTSAYLGFLAAELGVGPETPLRDVVAEPKEQA